MSHRWRQEDSEAGLREGRVFANPAVRKHMDTERQVTKWQERPLREAELGQNTFNAVDAGIATSPSARRVRTYCAQALVLFNVYGVPLSFGPWLEYYYTTTQSTTPLWSLSLIVALQILCIFAAPYPVWLLYHRWSSWRRLMVFIAVLAVVGAHSSLMVCKNHLTIMLLQGLLMGSGLGALLTLGMLFLGSHYNFNLPLVSWQGAIGSFLGALVYTATAWQSLRRDRRKLAHGASLAISVATLIPAFLLIKHSEKGNKQLEVRAPPSLWDVFVEKGSLWFVVGYMLVFFGLFIWPIYLLLILSQVPALHCPDTGGFTLLAMFGTAALASPTCANVRFRRQLGPVESFCAACLFAGASIVAPAWVPQLWVAFGCGAGYGVALGAILTLHIKVVALFHPLGVAWHPDMPARGAFVMALGGVSAAAGLVTAAVLLESRDNGAKVAALVAIGCMTLGGVVIAGLKWVRLSTRNR